MTPDIPEKKPATLADGRTIYEFLKESGLLEGLTTPALESIYKDHQRVVEERRKVSANDTELAKMFEKLLKNDPKTLGELKTNNPEMFRKAEEAYLNRRHINSN